MLDAFRIEILNLSEAIAKQEDFTKEQIQVDLRADREER